MDFVTAVLLSRVHVAWVLDQCSSFILQIPKRLYTLEELRLNNVRPEEFLSPEDSTLNNVRTILQVRIQALQSLGCGELLWQDGSQGTESTPLWCCCVIGETLLLKSV